MDIQVIDFILDYSLYIYYMLMMWNEAFNN